MKTAALLLGQPFLRRLVPLSLENGDIVPSLSPRQP
jgi:hypothetical protein